MNQILNDSLEKVMNCRASEAEKQSLKRILTGLYSQVGVLEKKVSKLEVKIGIPQDENEALQQDSGQVQKQPQGIQLIDLRLSQNDDGLFPGLHG